MDTVTFLTALNRIDYSMSLNTALTILAEAEKFGQPDTPDYTKMDKYALSSLVRDEDRFLDARNFLRENKKIQAIKDIRNVFGIGLKEAKDVADFLLPEYYTPTLSYHDSYDRDDLPF